MRLSAPAFASALEVLAANGVEVMIAAGDEYTPTPAISHAILTYNRGRNSGLADGIVITPSHNPPDSGGFKYNPPNGGPADSDVTDWIENARQRTAAVRSLSGVKQNRVRGGAARGHDSSHDYLADLRRAISAPFSTWTLIRSSGIRMGVDPLGGAGVHYWAAHRRALSARPHRRQRRRSIPPFAS